MQPEWDNISPNETDNLVKSMGRGLQAVIDAKERPTKYKL